MSPFRSLVLLPSGATSQIPDGNTLIVSDGITSSNGQNLVLGSDGASVEVEAGKSLLVPSVLDLLAAGTLLLGTTTATAITLGQAGVPVSAPGSITVGSSLDVTSAATLLLGTTTATAITIGRTGITTTVVGTLVSTSILKTKSGRALNAAFGGNPKKAVITFTTAFASANYSIALTPQINVSGTIYTPNIESQTASGFTINMGTNTIASLIACGWVAVLNGEST